MIEMVGTKTTGICLSYRLILPVFLSAHLRRRRLDHASTSTPLMHVPGTITEYRTNCGIEGEQPHLPHDLLRDVTIHGSFWAAHADTKAGSTYEQRITRSS